MTESAAPSSRTRSPRGCSLRRAPDPCALVIFGASGDLTHRKLMPALYSLAARHLLPPRFAIIGVARTEETTTSFRERDEGGGAAARARRVPAGRLGRARGGDALHRDSTSPTTSGEDELARARRARQASTSSAATASTTSPSRRPRSRRSSRRSASGAAPTGWTRLIVEKPFGHDLASARELNSC